MREETKDMRKWYEKQESEYTRLDWLELRNDVLEYLEDNRKHDT